jgi:hypothetical protein
MNPFEQSEKKDEDGLTPDERELANYWLPKFENDIEIEKRDASREISELQSLLEKFEIEHPVAELYEIINLTYQEAPNHPVREPARKDLNPIWANLEILKNETDISTEKYEELLSKYLYISKAVGIIGKDNKVRH